MLRLSGDRASAAGPSAKSPRPSLALFREEGRRRGEEGCHAHDADDLIGRCRRLRRLRRCRFALVFCAACGLSRGGCVGVVRAGVERKTFDTAGDRRCHGRHRANRGERGLRGLGGGAREAGRVLADSTSSRSAGIVFSGVVLRLAVHGAVHEMRQQ